MLRKENIDYLKRNGKIYFINADPERLYPTDSRPLSDTYEKLKKLYDERADVYNSTADAVVPDMLTPEEEAEFILKKRTEMMM